jgi:putative membrane protein insertion efficiency factor
MTKDGGLKPADTQGPTVRSALFALRVYKAYFSVLFAGNCRFEPTCSRYAYEAIERFGLARGAWLALRRLLRCHPLSRSFGFDAVPEKTSQEDAGLRAGAAQAKPSAVEVRS